MPAKRLHLLCSVLVLALLPGLCLAARGTLPPDTIAASCETAAEAAAQRTGVPVTVLKAISLNETGRKLDGTLRPWPWTVNMEGAGHWFDTYPEARAYVEQEFNRGARSFDVGCFQINYKWHGDAFSSIDQMFDPMTNALYAARFLSDLYAETGSWKAAAGAYHSRTKEYADQYAARFERLQQQVAQGSGAGPLRAPQNDGIPEIPDIVAMLGGGGGAGEPPPRPHVNTYPLLQRSGATQASAGYAPAASLFSVPQQTAQARPPGAGSLLRVAAQAAPTAEGGQ